MALIFEKKAEQLFITYISCVSLLFDMEHTYKLDYQYSYIPKYPYDFENILISEKKPSCSKAMHNFSSKTHNFCF